MIIHNFLYNLNPNYVPEIYKTTFNYDPFNYISKSLENAFKTVYTVDIPLLKIYYLNKELNLSKINSRDDLYQNFINVNSNQLKSIEKIYLNSKHLKPRKENYLGRLNKLNGFEFESYNNIFKS